MFTASLEQLAIPAAGSGRSLGRRSVAARLAVVARQAVCAVHGHSMLMLAERDRMSLRCLWCGAETPGWTIDVNPALRRRPR